MTGRSVYHHQPLKSVLQTKRAHKNCHAREMVKQSKKVTITENLAVVFLSCLLIHRQLYIPQKIQLPLYYIVPNQ